MKRIKFLGCEIINTGLNYQLVANYSDGTSKVLSTHSTLKVAKACLFGN